MKHKRVAPTSRRMADHSTTNGTVQQHVKLAALLRECANYVERNEFHPDLYQALGQLHQYTGEHSGNPQKSVGSSVDDRDISPKTSGSFDQQAHQVMHSLGKTFSKGLGLTPMAKPVTHSQAQSTSQKNADRVRADLKAFHGKPKAEVGHRSKENDWCDEHFCLGCQCKSHLQQQQTATSSTTASTTATAAATVAATQPSAAPEPRSSSMSPTPRDTTRREARPEPAPRVAVTTTTTTTTLRVLPNLPFNVLSIPIPFSLPMDGSNNNVVPKCESSGKMYSPVSWKDASREKKRRYGFNGKPTMP